VGFAASVALKLPVPGMIKWQPLLVQVRSLGAPDEPAGGPALFASITPGSKIQNANRTASMDDPSRRKV
jgi:hypothetical protein